MLLLSGMAIFNKVGSFTKTLVRKKLLPRLNKARKTRLLPAFAAGDHIPKIIHQTYPTTGLPAVLESNVRRIRAMNPGWEYRFYSDADVDAFISNEYGELIYRYFQRIDPQYGAARADLFRYLLIYKCGGIYLDIKSTLDEPLDQVIRYDDVFLLSQWNIACGEKMYGKAGQHAELTSIPGGEFQQWHVVAAPGHPLLHAVIEAVLANIDIYNPEVHGTRKKGVLRVTGPIAYTLGIYPLLHLHPHRLVDARHELGFRYSIYPAEVFSAHKALFKVHYSDVAEPLVTGSGQKLLAIALRSCRAILRWRASWGKGFRHGVSGAGDTADRGMPMQKQGSIGPLQNNNIPQGAP
jgi:hypothetical protein